MESNRSKLYKGLPLSVMADSKEILTSLKSTTATNKINALFSFLRGSPTDDLTKPENLDAFLKRCVTRRVVDKIKKNNGVEETEEEYLKRISQDQYDTARIAENIRLDLDEAKNVHFYVRFGKEKESECEVTTEDTLAVVSSVYHQFIIDLEEQEKMLLEYALTESSLKKLLDEDDREKEIKSLKLLSEDMELKNHKLHEELISCQQNVKKTKEEKEKVEGELKEDLEKNRLKLRQINVLLEKKVQKEAIMQINMKKMEMDIVGLRKSLLEAEQKNKELQQKLEENKSNEKLKKTLTIELEKSQEKIKEISSSLSVYAGVLSKTLGFDIHHLLFKNSHKKI